MQKINLWDENSQRLMALEKNLRVLMSAMRIQAEVQLNNEPPLLARNGINGKTPAVQINDGDFWTHTPGEPVSVENLEKLLAALRREKILK